MKEYRLSVGIDIGDFNVRVKNAREYLLKGYRIKASIRFHRGRELAHLDRGFEVFKRFAEALKDVAIVDTKAAMDGERNASMILAPIKEK
jgi:translation initiation factor IF-3